jgi:hypothetical protein
LVDVPAQIGIEFARNGFPSVTTRERVVFNDPLDDEDRPGKAAIMTDRTIDLDQHRGMAAQKATELRRLLAEVQANDRNLRRRQDELESHLVAAPATTWAEAAEKASYLLNLFAVTVAAQDPRRQKLIAAVLSDFARLSAESEQDA